LLNAKDVNHAAALRITKQIRKAQVEVVTSWDVVSETATLLRYRLGYRAARTFLTDALPGLAIFQPSEEDRSSAIRFFLRQQELRLSMCDALSFVIVSTQLNWVPCLSFDADFGALGLSVVR
jgi:predicted nucleic acid-binding protein